MAIASLVLGIVSLVFIFFGPLSLVGIAAGIVGIILGAMARKKLKAASQPTGTATAGLVMSIIGAALSAIMYIACIACAAGLANAAKDGKFDKAFGDALKDGKGSEELKKELENMEKPK